MNKRVGTVCFVVENNKVLLANIEYFPSDRKWNGLGGFVEDQESPEDAVIRELNEETDIIVSKEDLVRAKELELDIKLIVFIAKKWGGNLIIKDPSIKELRWFDIDDMPYSKMHEGNDKWLPELLRLA